MTTLQDIRNGVNAALKTVYPKLKVYGVDTIEGYSKPSFFVYVNQTFAETTKNAIHKNVEIEIDYVQKAPNESEGFAFFAEMEKLFCHKLKTKKRQLSTSNLYSNFEGEHNNIPCFYFDVEFWDAIEKEPDNSALMGDFEIKTEVKRWDYQP